MKKIFLLPTLLFFGLNASPLDRSSCTGDIVIALDDVYLRVEPVDPTKTILVVNLTEVEMRVEEKDEETLLSSYTLDPQEEKFFPANEMLNYREIVTREE